MSVRYLSELEQMHCPSAERAVEQVDRCLDEMLDEFDDGNLLSEYVYRVSLSREECLELLSGNREILKSPQLLGNWLKERIWEYPEEYIIKMSGALSKITEYMTTIPQERQFSLKDTQAEQALKNIFFQYDWIIREMMDELKRAHPDFHPASEYALKYDLSYDEAESLKIYMWKNQSKTETEKKEFLAQWFSDVKGEHLSEAELSDIIVSFGTASLPDYEETMRKVKAFRE